MSKEERRREKEERKRKRKRKQAKLEKKLGKARESDKTYTWARLEQSSELTEDLIESIAELVAKGHSFREVADRFCIPYSSLFGWRIHGERYLNGEQKEEWRLPSQLVLALRASSGQYAMNRVSSLHFSKDWQRDLKILERRLPEVYATNPMGGSDDSFSGDETFL